MDYSIAKQLTTPLLFTHKGPIHTSSAFAVGTPVLGCPKPIISIPSNSDTAGAVSLRALNSCLYLPVGRPMPPLPKGGTAEHSEAWGDMLPPWRYDYGW